MKRDYSVLALYAIMTLLCAAWLVYWSIQQSKIAVISYSEFSRFLHDGEISVLEVHGDELRGVFKKPRLEKTKFVTQRVDPALAHDLDERGVHYKGVASTSWQSWLSWFVLPFLVLLGWNALRRRRWSDSPGPSGAWAFGKSRAKAYVEKNTRVTFLDVAGVDEAKQELQEVVAFLKNPKHYGRLGARVPKGILLVGPPGTGKTLLARAVAGEAGVPFFSMSGSEFVELFVGVGAARVRDLFQQARLRAPSIIFIDELDALGRARNAAGYSGGHVEKDQTLNQLLAELDGFDPSVGVVLLAATNRPEMLDAALLRAGRFDRQVLVDRPDKHGRVQILQVHTRKLPCAAVLSLDEIAAMTPGFTGADLANLCNEAALAATRRDASEITSSDFTAAIERIVAGLEKKNRLLNAFERDIVAHHETGHALLGYVLSHGDRVQKVSIIPRGIGALGYTLQRPTEDRYLMTRDELEDKLAVLMGGRAAEYLVFGRFSTGAADDLAKATDIAHAMAARYGMVPELGHVTYDVDASPWLGPTFRSGGSSRCSDRAAYDIELAQKAATDRAFERARAILAYNRKQLDAAANALLERETLTEHELNQLFAGAQVPPNPDDERNARSIALIAANSAAR